MLAVIIAIVIVVFILWAMALAKVAGDADDREEEWYKEHEDMFKK